MPKPHKASAAAAAEPRPVGHTGGAGAGGGAASSHGPSGCTVACMRQLRAARRVPCQILGGRENSRFALDRDASRAETQSLAASTAAVAGAIPNLGQGLEFILCCVCPGRRSRESPAPDLGPRPQPKARWAPGTAARSGVGLQAAALPCLRRRSPGRPVRAGQPAAACPLPVGGLRAARF